MVKLYCIVFGFYLLASPCASAAEPIPVAVDFARDVPQQIETLRRWIADGAVWKETLEPVKHWTYVAPQRPQVPQSPNPHPIDAFVRARLEKLGLKPSPEADRAVLLRRVTLDLVGLPPTPKDIDTFLVDTRPDAFERAVDRLLASPQFGEKWARMWLDLAHYADSHGFQRDDLRDLWPYRDWVIKALNDDMPFDRFTIEQLAGDLLPNATESQKIATGFGRCSPTNVEAGSDPEETRISQVIDRVNTTAAIWLGTTLECAQCHDHKFDPFSQKEYYRLLAYFNNTAIEADRANPKVPGSIKFLGPVLQLRSENDAERVRIAKRLKEVAEQLEVRRKELSVDATQWEAALAGSAKNASQTHVLSIDQFQSKAGSPHKTLDDKSVLLTDDPPDKDTYIVTVKTDLRNITGLVLECLTDPSLPGKGPGRGDPQRPNFVLNSFRVTSKPANGPGEERALKFKAASASFSQNKFDVANILDNSGKSGWAINPQFHKSHWARFETADPVGFDGGSVLTFTLVQEFGAGRTIGRLRLSAITGDPKGTALPSDVVALLNTPREKRTEAQGQRLLDYRFEKDAVATKLRAARTAAEKEMQSLKPPTTLVMQELAKPRETHVFLRGDFRNPLAAIQAGTPNILHPIRDGDANRLALAQWLVDRRNPLTARVQVNRLWSELFGRGLVSTVEDFGTKGEAPTHPDLLDWLAVEFMDNGWSIKKILRTMVISATYRQSSKLTAELLAKDDNNALLARGPRFRLDAETIRDNALAAAGLLSLKQYGPPIRPYQPDGLWTKIGGDKVEYIVSPGEEKHRRGIYVVWKRASLYPSFMNFDASSRLTCTVKRSRTNTPLQALTLLNDPVYVEAALALAKRVVIEQKAGTTADRLTHGFRLCVSRTPNQREIEVLKGLFEKQLAAFRKDHAKAKSLVGAFDIPPGISLEEFAAWYAVATALLNLDEMITKG